jgi:cytochrome c
MRKVVVLMAAMVVVLVAADSVPANRGREIFEKRCTGCHSLDNLKVGPALRGVYGRRSGADPRFPYSDALAKARLTWDDATLQRWLADPDAVVPGNDMSFRLDNADERAAIVEYLKQLPGKSR